MALIDYLPMKYYMRYLNSRPFCWHCFIFKGLNSRLFVDIALSLRN